MEWFRFYTDTVYDRKMRRLPPAQRWLWVAVLTLARQSPKPGYLLLSDGSKITVEDLEDIANVEFKDVVNGIRYFTEFEWLESDESGVYFILDWEHFVSTDWLRQSPEVWSQTRQRIFERDGFTCQYCGVHGVRLECDHVIPISRGGTNEDSNLATACRECNRSKGNKTLDEWIAHKEGREM